MDYDTVVLLLGNKWLTKDGIKNQIHDVEDRLCQNLKLFYLIKKLAKL